MVFVKNMKFEKSLERLKGPFWASFERAARGMYFIPNRAATGGGAHC
jgi:hypothetical protein